MASSAEHDLAFAEADNNKEKPFGILRLQDEKANLSGDNKASGSTVRGAGGDGRWQVPIFALARKASETFSGSIHVLPKVSDHRTSLPEEWIPKGETRGRPGCRMDASEPGAF